MTVTGRMSTSMARALRNHLAGSLVVGRTSKPCAVMGDLIRFVEIRADTFTHQIADFRR
jgi:hypothetical protein